MHSSCFTELNKLSYFPSNTQVLYWQMKYKVQFQLGFWNPFGSWDFKVLHQLLILGNQWMLSWPTNGAPVFAFWFFSYDLHLEFLPLVSLSLRTTTITKFKWAPKLARK